MHPVCSQTSELTAFRNDCPSLDQLWGLRKLDTLTPFLGAVGTTLPEPQETQDAWEILPSLWEVQQSGYQEGGLPVDSGYRIQTESSMWSKLAKTNSNPSHIGTEACQLCWKLHLPSDLGCSLSYMEKKRMERSCLAMGVQMVGATEPLEDQPLAPGQITATPSGLREEQCSPRLW